MPCQENYIGLDNDIPSRSGLYIDSLPGMDIELIDGLRKNAKDSMETWNLLYKRAWDNLVSELTHLLQDKFYVDSKLVSRETSEFKADVNFSADISGVSLEFKLPKYARLHIISVEVFSDQEYASPEFTLSITKDDVDGELLFEKSEEITEGRNTIYIDQDFEVDKVFLWFDPALFAFRETENKKYKSQYISFNCNECTFDCGGYQGKVVQVNGGGLNVKYNIICSVEKFLCENINLFRQAFFYRIGLEIVFEQRFGMRLNRFTTMTLERSEELTAFYERLFHENLQRSVKSQNIREDPYCFACKGIVSKKSSTP